MSFESDGILLWNSLPTVLREESNFKVFKGLLDKWNGLNANALVVNFADFSTSCTRL